MKQSKTIYHIILDKSGSMQDCIDNTISGFNEQIQHIRKMATTYEDQEITLGLTTFSDRSELLFFDAPSDKATLLSKNNYRPDGMTALLDAIGHTSLRIEEYMKSNRNLPTTAVVVILTDGHENSSTSFNLAEIRTLISRLEATGNWTFSFIGATLDAAEVAESMAIKRQNSFAFDKSEMKSAVWNKLSDSMDLYFNKKQRGSKDLNLFDEK
jgi:hypothetical protein